MSLRVAKRIIPLMDDPEKPKVWWTENEDGARRIIAISALVALILAAVLFYPDIKNILGTHPWWQDTLAVLAAIALPVLAFFELRHSGEANTLRIDANRLRAEANDLQDQIGSLTAELAAERNKHLQQIAKNTQKPVSQAERNAETLRKHLGANVAVSEGKGVWGTAPQIVEVNENNVATLFSPYSPSSSIAWCVQVHCDELEITEIPQGSCPLRLRVLKRYGADVQLGQITKWEDRSLPTAAPIFAKGGTPYYATFSKQGSGETRSLYVYASADGANSFLLEASGEKVVVADNVEISKRFALLEVEYCAAGFNRNGSGSGGSPHRLFIR